jgi:hypothetical protein
MRKILLVFIFFLLLACQLPGITPTPVPTAPQEKPTLAPTVQAIEATAESTPTAIIQAIEPTEVDTPTPNAIGPIPVSSIQIEGVPYQAYQIPGDPFRFVCQEPCPLDPRYITAEYAGFRLAHPKLIELTGVDTLAELQPVDMHLVLEDSICGVHPGGHASMYPGTHKAYTCSDGPGYYPTIEEKIQKAALAEDQYFTLHEYMHTIFFGRISGKAGNFQDSYAEFFHDYVVPLPSYAIGIMDPSGFCSYRNQNPSRGDYPQWLISELCRQNGFQLKDVALSLIELDKLVQSSEGQVEMGFTHRVPTVAQYRDILNRLLGSDTTRAFADACWPPELFGNSFSVPPACPSLSTGGSPTPIK